MVYVYWAQKENSKTVRRNTSCFDCDNKPAHWASISNGIFLCLDCSGENVDLELV